MRNSRSTAKIPPLARTLQKLTDMAVIGVLLFATGTSWAEHSSENEPISLVRRMEADFTWKEIQDCPVRALPATLNLLFSCASPDSESLDGEHTKKKLSNEEIERRKRLWREARRRRFELPAEEIGRRKKLWHEAALQLRAERYLEKERRSREFYKYPRVTLGLNLAIGNPLLCTPCNGSAWDVGLGITKGVNYWIPGAKGLFIGGDLRFDFHFPKIRREEYGWYTTGWGTWERFTMISAGPVIGFERRIVFVFLRPAFSYETVFFDKGWHVRDENAGISIGIGVGFNPKLSICPQLFLNFNFPLSRNEGWHKQDPDCKIGYSAAFVLSLGVVFRM